MSKKRVTKKTTINPTKSKIASTGSSDIDGSKRTAANAASMLADARMDKSSAVSDSGLLFNKTTYMYILGGIGLMVIGFFLMAGGNNTDPNVFDESVIYSTRRTLIAPIFILAGLVVQVLAIFKK